MGSDASGRVIRPPMEDVTAGRVFRPDARFKYKQWIEGIIAALALWGLTIAVVLFAGVMNQLDPPHYPSLNYFWDWAPIVSLWYWVIALFWFVPAMIAVPFYVGTFEYSVSSTGGKAMPEIFVKKGLVNVTKKHVPFRTVTNILSRAGPLDRILGIGTIEIETAGFSGSPQGGRNPEEKIEGVVFYEEVRDYILQELRKFRDPYTGTEVVHPVDEVVPRLPDSLDDEMLITLREIRNVLEKIDAKLGKERE